MFRKENSAAATSSKSNTTLRKSDKRNLRDAITSSFHHRFTADDPQTDTDPGETSTLRSPTSSTISQMKKCIEDILIVRSAEVTSRKLKLPDTTVTLYLRSPSPPNSTHHTDDGSGLGGNGWPFRSTQQPIFFVMDDSTNRSKVYIPCLATLAYVPNLLPIVWVPSAVSKFLCRGAGTCYPSGIISVDPTIEDGDVVGICARNNHQPFAVGVFRADTGNVDILCVYGDDLWRLQIPDADAPNTNTFDADDDDEHARDWDDGHYGNPGFEDGKYVHGLKMFADNESDGDDSSSNTNNDGSTEADDIGECNETTTSMAALLMNDETGGTKRDNQTSNDARATVAVGETDITSAAAVCQEDNNQEHKPQSISNNAENKGNEHPTKNNENDKEPPIEEDENSQTYQNDLLTKSFHVALCTTVTDKLLPLPLSQLFGGHILPARPKGTTLQMKLTSYKKISDFLMEQMYEESIIEVSSKKEFIVRVNRSHPLLRAVKKELKVTAAASASGSNGTTAGTPSSSKPRMAIANLVIIPQRIVTLMRTLPPDAVSASTAKSAQRRNTGYLTHAECKAILDAYITANNLVDPLDPIMVAPDGPICDVLYRPTKKQLKENYQMRTEYPSRVSRPILFELWISKMDAAYALVKLPMNEIVSMKRGIPPKITIEVEKRQNKKHITRIRGLEAYHVHAQTFAQDVSKRFACAASVETTAAKGRAALMKGCSEITVQGHLVEELQALLTGDEGKMLSCGHGGVKDGNYGVPRGKHVFEVVTRKGAMAKNRKR
mmetsp:Transcript_25841/g.31671  ORF Transcript_25841/g.31671 Transcript_25841/m.31671 type:complete len:777 (+) Transcript_25841:125-2455(+)